MEPVQGLIDRNPASMPGWPLDRQRTTGLVNLFVTALLLVCVTLIIVGSARRWLELYSLGDKRGAVPELGP